VGFVCKAINPRVWFTLPIVISLAGGAPTRYRVVVLTSLQGNATFPHSLGSGWVLYAKLSIQHFNSIANSGLVACGAPARYRVVVLTSLRKTVS